MKERENREIINSTPLPELAQFGETDIKPGEAMDIALATTPHKAHIFTTEESADASVIFREVLGKNSKDMEISTEDDPIQEALKVDDPTVIPLVMHSATDPVLFERMFSDGPRLGQLLMDHIYLPNKDRQSPSVHVAGVSNQGLTILENTQTEIDENVVEHIRQTRNDVLDDMLTVEDFRNILRSDSVQKIRAHALGPVGTNISQAMKQYVESLGVEGKTDLITHPAGIEPMAYAEMAREEVADGVVPIHMECAVYYEMKRLFDERSEEEVIFADHHNMNLDSMQLASIKPIEVLAKEGSMRIATHPSPKPLVDPWVDSNNAEWVKATSNSAAAQMVKNDEVDACVTTGSGLRETEGVVSRHIFGKPNMFFTIATSLNQEQLKQYQR